MNVKRKHNWDETTSKRQQILNAAYLMFSQKGFHRTTIDEIIALADTGKGTVYNYFSNKEQLFYTLVQERSEPLYQKLGEVVVSKTSPLEKLSKMVGIHLKFMVENAELWRVMIHEMRGVGNIQNETTEKYGRFSAKTIELMEQVIDEGQSQGVFNYPEAKKAAYAMFSMVMVIVYSGLIDKDLEKTAKDITQLFLYGITGQTLK